MNQIQQQGKDMLGIIEKYEVPYEFHNALWAAYEAGAHMGFWKATDTVSTPDTVRTPDLPQASSEPNHSGDSPNNTSKEG